MVITYRIDSMDCLFCSSHLQRCALLTVKWVERDWWTSSSLIARRIFPFHMFCFQQLLLRSGTKTLSSRPFKWLFYLQTCICKTMAAWSFSTHIAQILSGSSKACVRHIQHLYRSMIGLEQTVHTWLHLWITTHWYEFYLYVDVCFQCHFKFMFTFNAISNFNANFKFISSLWLCCHICRL